MRENKGLTQKELAERVNLSQQTIGHYEVGRAKPDLETLQKLSEIFNCSVDYLLGRTDVPNPPASPDPDIKDAPLAFYGNAEGLNIEELEKIINRAVKKALEEREREKREKEKGK